MEKPLLKETSSIVSRGNMKLIIRDIFKSKKAQNIIIDKTITEENVCLTDLADEIKEIYEGHKSRTKDIKRVGERMTQNQKQNLKQEKIRHAPKSDTSRNVPKIVNKKDIQKYHLIEKDEIFSTERLQTSEISLTEDDSYQTRGEEIRQMFMEQKLPILSPRKAADYVLPEPRSECKCLDEINVPNLNKEPSKTMTSKNCDILRAHPPSVCFTNYKMDRIEEQSIFIQNVSSRVVKFSVRPLKDSSRFKISWDPLPGYTKMIAPGIRMKIKVIFQANCLRDEEDCLNIIADDGSILPVMLEAKRNPTLLKVIGTKPAAAPNAVHCGECLLGNINTTILQLCNCGRDAGFWINNELVWPLWDSLNVSSKAELAIYPFTISPQYFQVQHGAVIKLNVMFKPTIAGLYSQKVYILCDNCSIQELEIKGYGLQFDPQFLAVQDFEKNYHLDQSHDMMAMYRLNMGKCLVAKKVSKLFTVVNGSGLKLQYSWKKRNVNLISLPSHNLHGLHDSAVSIDPEKGTFKPKSEQDFLVNCATTGLEVGMYKTVLQLYIENLPKEALPPQENTNRFTKILDKFMPAKPVQILLYEVELCLEVEPYRITIEPSIIQIQGKIRCTDKPLRRTVTVHNHGSNSVMVEWQSSKSAIEEGPCCHLVMRPSKIQNCYPHYSFRLSICPAAPGKVVEKLRLIIDNGAKILELLVKLEIYSQIISLSTNMLNFGLVKRGTLVKKTFRIINESQLKTTWRLQEYIYNANTQMLTMNSNTNVSASRGYVDKKYRFKDVIYYLNTMIPGIWCSVLELTVKANEGNEHVKEYILVMADIVKPKLMINVTCGKDNTLQLFCPLYLGIECKRSVKIHNLTNLPTSFSWAEPVGCDSHKLRVTLSPQEHTIPAAASLCVGLTILPLYMGSVRHFFVPCIVEKTNDLLLLSIQVSIENVHVTFFVPSVNSIAANSEDNEPNDFFIQIPWPLKHDVPLDNKDSIEQYSSGLHYLDVCRCPIPGFPKKEMLSMPKGTIQTGLLVSKVMDTKLQNNHLDFDLFQYSQQYQTYETKYEGKTVIATAGSSLNLNSMDKLADMKITETKDGPLIHIPGVEGIPSMDFIPAFPVAEVKQSETETQKEKKGHKQGEDKKKPRGKNDKRKAESRKDAEEEKEEVIESKTKKKKGNRKISSKGKDENMTLPSDTESEINDTDTLSDKKIDGADLKGVSDALLPITSGIQYSLPAEIIFSKLPCHKVSKKSFTVKNETPIAAYFTVKVQNFADKEETFPKDRNMNENCHNTLDKLHTFIKPGIIVTTNPKSAELSAYEAITVEVLIYATTWGNYTDYIHCKVSALPLFIIKLSIEVTGFPLFFPMADSCSGEGELRFGAVTYQGIERVRRIRICNTSSINIFLTWHVFLVEEDDSNNPLQLLMEINKFAESELLPASNSPTIEEQRTLMACFCKKCDDWRESITLGIIPSNWKEDFEMFQVEPREMVVPPACSRFLKVKLNPRVAHEFGDTNVISAVAAGMIHLSIQDREEKDLYRRPVWPNLQPIILKLNTQVENSFFKLHILQGKCQFQASACDILTAQKTHSINQLFVFCYHGKAPIAVEVTATKPFNINKISTINSNDEKTSCSNTREIVLTEGIIIEIELDCILDLTHVQQGYMWLKRSMNSLEEPTNSITLYRYLTFTPTNHSPQEMQLEVKIYYPCIQVRPKIVDFGPVFLGTTKGLSFTIENRSGFDIWVYLKKHCQSCIFTSTPSPLFIPCTSVGDVGVSDVQVNFTPSKAISHQEVISVETLIPGDVHDVLLTGCGTLNEKYNKRKQ